MVLYIYINIMIYDAVCVLRACILPFAHTGKTRDYFGSLVIIWCLTQPCAAIAFYEALFATL